MNLAKILKDRRDAERRLEQTSPVPIFNGGAPDSVEGGGGESLASGITAVELAAGLAGKSDTDHNHDSDYSAIDHTHNFHYDEGDALPTASESLRGYRFLVKGGAGVADTMYRCIKNSSDAYEWVAD